MAERRPTEKTNAQLRGGKREKLLTNKERGIWKVGPDDREEQIERGGK